MTTVRTIESVPYSRVLADALAVPGTNTMRVAEDFFGLADIVKEDQKLARALTDPSRSASDKRALVRTAFGPHVTAATSSVVAAMASDHWARPEDVDAAYAAALARTRFAEKGASSPSSTTPSAAVRSTTCARSCSRSATSCRTRATCA